MMTAFFLKENLNCIGLQELTKSESTSIFGGYSLGEFWTDVKDFFSSGFGFQAEGPTSPCMGGTSYYGHYNFFWIRCGGSSWGDCMQDS